VASHFMWQVAIWSGSSNLSSAQVPRSACMTLVGLEGEVNESTETSITTSVRALNDDDRPHGGICRVGCVRITRVKHAFRFATRVLTARCIQGCDARAWQEGRLTFLD
jgi:hypothetical protein